MGSRPMNAMQTLRVAQLAIHVGIFWLAALISLGQDHTR